MVIMSDNDNDNYYQLKKVGFYSVPADSPRPHQGVE